MMLPTPKSSLSSFNDIKEEKLRSLVMAWHDANDAGATTKIIKYSKKKHNSIQTHTFTLKTYEKSEFTLTIKANYKVDRPWFLKDKFIDASAWLEHERSEDFFVAYVTDISEQDFFVIHFMNWNSGRRERDSYLKRYLGKNPNNIF